MPGTGKKSLHALIGDFMGSTEFNQEIGFKTQTEYELGLADIKTEWTNVKVQSL